MKSTEPVLKFRIKLMQSSWQMTLRGVKLLVMLLPIFWVSSAKSRAETLPVGETGGSKVKGGVRRGVSPKLHKAAGCGS